MRYYSFSISDPGTGFIWKPSRTGLGFEKSPGGSTFSTVDSQGNFNPNALCVEFDFPVYPFAQTQGKAIIRFWGIGLAMISQASQLTGQNFSLSAGMSKGLPLATNAASQAGLIAQGQIFQSFGNWAGTNQTLDMVCYPGLAAIDQNIMFNWPAGMQLSTAISQTLQQAFPKYQAQLNISASLQTNQDQKGHYDTLPQFADYILQKSQEIGQPLYGSSYPGVQISCSGMQIRVSDGKGAAAVQAKSISYYDLIGQPTWLGAFTIGFSTTLRADIAIGDMVRLPAGIKAPYALTTVAAAQPGALARSSTAFQGMFLVNEVHHFANSRQPDAESWNTSFQAVAVA